ncbi:MAG: hypothetical protein AAGA30_11345, partial [Planctomycetota bacterium]
ELEAYSEGAPYFKRLARASGCSELADLLENADDDQPMFVDLKKHNDAPWYIWFGFTLVARDFHPRLRLAPQVNLPSNTPKRITRLYKAFGGICDSSFIGGFMPPEQINLGANEFVMDHHDIRLPEDSYPWFDFGNGDYAGWLPSGMGFMYEHETGELTESVFDDLYDMLTSSLNRSPFEDLLE